MRAATVIIFLLGQIVASRAEEAKAPETLLSAYVTATENSDFESVVNDVHPFVLRLFKEHTLDIVAAAVDDFPEEAVTAAFQGLTTLDELSKIPEKEFWVYVMSNAYSYTPEVTSGKGIDIVGSIEEGEFLHFLYRRDGDLKSTDKIEKIKAPRTFSFRKNGNRWCYWSYQISAVERYVRWVAKRRPIAPQKSDSEQDGADKPATDVESKAEGEEKPKMESDGRSQ